MANRTVNLPEGFVLESEQNTNLPAGFVLEEPQDINLPDGFILDEPTERGRIAELGAAHARGWLGMGEKLVGASQKFSPVWGKYGIGGLYRGYTASEEDLKLAIKQTGGDKEKAVELILSGKTLTKAREKIKSAQVKFPKTRKGLGGWAINVLGEGSPILMTSIASGGAGWAGPFMNMFIQAGEGAYADAKEAGASEASALRDYALVGLAEGTLEMWGVSKLLKFKSAGKGSLKALVKNVKQGLWKQAKGDIKNITGNTLKSALVEGLEEASQSGASLAVAALPGGTELPRKPDGSIDYKAMVEQVGMEAAGGALLGGVVPAGMNLPSGAVTAADPSIQRIELAARTIQNSNVSKFEKARGIMELQTLLPEDYQWTGKEIIAEAKKIPISKIADTTNRRKEGGSDWLLALEKELSPKINVYQDTDGNNYNEEDLVVKEIDGNRVPVAPNGDPVVINQELSGSAIEQVPTKQPTNPFYVSDQAKKIVALADKFQKNLSEYEAKRPELKKEEKGRKGQKFAIGEQVLKSQQEDGPRVAMYKAKAAMEGFTREVFPEFGELFTREDLDTMQQAVNESTLTISQKLDVTEVFDALEKNLMPYPSSIEAFDDFFHTQISAVSKNKPKTWWQKTWRVATVPGSVVKAILSSIDHSAIGIQGFPTLITHPIIALKAAGRGYRAISEDYTRLREIEIKTHPNYNLLRAARLPITEIGSHTKGEEEFTDNLAKKIPGVGRFIAGSERIHTTTLNSMRFDYANKILEGWGEDAPFGKVEQMAQHIGNMTGRGTGDPKGWFERHMDVWSTFFWVPRMVKGTVGTVTDFITKPEIRREAAHDLAQGVATLAALTFLFSLIPEVEIEDNALSPDIGKGRIGTQRFNLWGRYGQYIRFVAQMMYGEVKSPTTGEIYQKKRLDVFTDFLKTKLNPITGIGLDIATGQTFAGKRMRLEGDFLTEYIADHVTPLFIQDVRDAIKFQGLEGASLPLMIMGAHGIDMATYEVDTRQEAHNLKNRYAHEYYGTDWNQLGPVAQETLRARTPLIRQYEEDARREQESFEWRGKRDQLEFEAGRKVIKGLSKDIRQMYEDAGAKILPITQTISYNGIYWKLTLERYKKYQQDMKPALETALRNLKALPQWEQLDVRVQRAMIEELTKQVAKYVRQQMVNEISFADLEREGEGENGQRQTE